MEQSKIPEDKWMAKRAALAEEHNTQGWSQGLAADGSVQATPRKVGGPSQEHPGDRRAGLVAVC